MMRERYNSEGHPFYTGSLMFHDGVIAFPKRAKNWPALLKLPCAPL